MYVITNFSQNVKKMLVVLFPCSLLRIQEGGVQETKGAGGRGGSSDGMGGLYFLIGIFFYCCML